MLHNRRKAGMIRLPPANSNDVHAAVEHSRVGGGALSRLPPSAVQTASADFPRAAFTKT